LSLNKQNILVVGGTGFIGFHLIKKLVKNKNYKIISFSTKKPSTEKKLSNVQYIICDITNKSKIKKKLINKKIDYVINLGGYVDHKNKSKTYKSHYIGSKNLVESLINKRIKRFIQLGSSVEYGFLKSPQKENLQLKQKSLKSTYGQAKFKTTKLLIKYYKAIKFPAVILRLYIAYGPNQNTNRFIPIIIDSCLKKKEFDCSKGTQIRDFIYVDDLVDIIIKCFKNKNILGKILNVGTGKQHNIKNIINKIVKQTSGGIPKFGKIKLRKDEPLKLFPDITKIKKYLNWKPKYSFNRGLKKTINYYKNAK